MERIFYSSRNVDIALGLPIYIFDTSYLPSVDEIDYGALVITLAQCLPHFPYIVIIFSCGLNKIGWIWGIKFILSFLEDPSNATNLRKVITVHESWFLKSITQFFTNLKNAKMSFGALNRFLEIFIPEKLDFKDLNQLSKPRYLTPCIRCGSISDLSNYIDISLIKISLNVYKYDAQLGSFPSLSMRKTPLINPLTNFDPQISQTFLHHFYNLFEILHQYGTQVPHIFHKPGNKLSADILYQCIDRNQVFWINDWDLYCIATVFKRLLHLIPFSLVDHNLIPIPIHDSLEYTLSIFAIIIDSLESNSQHGAGQALYQLCSMCFDIQSNPSVTMHSAFSIAKSLVHSISHQPVGLFNNENVDNISCFLANVFKFWPVISPQYTFALIEDCLCGKSTSDVFTLSCNPIQDLRSGILFELPASDVSDIRVDLSNIQDPPLSDSIHGAKKSAINDLHVLSMNYNYKVCAMTSEVALSSDSDIDSHQKTTENSKSATCTQFSLDSIQSAQINNSVAIMTPSSLSTSSETEHSRVPQLSKQWPPQKYKFTIERNETFLPPGLENDASPIGYPKAAAIRGRKVGQLARLFEERSLGLDIIRGLQRM